MAKILTTDNLAAIKEKAKNSIHDYIDSNFQNCSKEGPNHTTHIPIQNIYFNLGELSPEFVYYEKAAMNNDDEEYKAWVSIGDPGKENKDPLEYKISNHMNDFSDTKWPANSNIQTFKNKKNINITLYFHNTFGTRGDSPKSADSHAADFIGKTGVSDRLGNYMKFDASTGTLHVRTTDIK